LIYEYDRTLEPRDGQQRPPLTKHFATIFVKNAKGVEQNVALELISRGFAELVWHGKNEEKRSMAYVDLENASKKARAKKEGLYKFMRWDKEQNVERPDEKARKIAAKQNAIVDYSGNDDGTITLGDRIDLNHFLKKGERNGRVLGVVEFVFGANRVKIWIPRRNCCIALRLAGIRVGNWGLDKYDKESVEAKEYLNRTILQREVEIKITSTGQGQLGRRGGRSGGRRGRGGGGRGGRGGGSGNPNLDGHILLNGVNVADYLLRQGLAKRITGRYGSPQKEIPETANFEEMEMLAVQDCLGVHKADHVEEGDDSKNIEELASRSRTGRSVEVVVSHIASATDFFVNDANSKQMSILNKGLQEMSKNPDLPQAKEVKSGRKVKFAALYDGYYARCRVSNRVNRNDDGGGKKGDHQWFVDFIDFGNRARVSLSALAKLPDELRIDRIPPLAKRCRLAGIDVEPPSKNQRVFEAAGHFAASQVFSVRDQKLKMRILYDDGRADRWYVDLFVGDESINVMLARRGFVRNTTKYLPHAFVERSEYGKKWSDEHCKAVDDYLGQIEHAMAAAKGEHLMLFKYGDIDDDDEDDNLGT